jgi:hypothetical protein
MISLSTTVARRRIFYPRPIVTMPDILMIGMPAEYRGTNPPFGNYHPILIETIAEQDELDAFLEEECGVSSFPDLLDARPSALQADHITIAHYGPPFEDWPYVLLCRWPPDLTATAPEELRMFIRHAYTIELFADRDRLERASDELLGLLKRRRRTRIEIILPDWSATPGSEPH